MMEFDYRGQKIMATQVWAGAIPEMGTLILGETPEQAQETLRRLEGGVQPEELNSIEIELRLIMAYPNRTKRLELLQDWIRMRVHEMEKGKK